MTKLKRESWKADVMKKKKAEPNRWQIKEVDNSDRCWWLLVSLFMAALMAGIVISCTEEPIQKGAEAEGETATLRLEVKADSLTDVETRATAVDENTIKDLHVLVYNEKGDLIGQRYTAEASTSTTFTVNTRSGNNCTIYVIANTNNSALLEGTATTINKIKALTTAQLSSWDLLSENTYIVMVGSLTNVNITPGSNDAKKVSVSRIAAKVTLDVKTDSTDITIKNYKVCSLPALSYYLPNPIPTEADKDDTENTNPGTDAATALAKWVQGTEIAVNTTTLQKTLYMYENRRGVNTGITDQKNKNGTNAPTNATYLLINGEAGGYKATWKIYLGANNTSNFNIKRNCSYTYTIRLKEGNIADTRVEVTEKTFTTTDAGSSNCYIVHPQNAVTIPVSRANESFIAIDGSTTQITASTEWEAEIVWQSSPFLIYLKRSTRAGKGTAGRFTVAATDATKQGNAVVAIRNKATGNILWSWHIWVTKYDGTTRFTHNNGDRDFIFMDRALGAASTTAGELSSCGLIYQWGRKDPFPGIGQEGGSWSVSTNPIHVYNASGVSYEITKKPVPNVLPDNLTNATRNPDTFYYNTASPYDWFVYNSSSTQNNDLWSSGNIALGTATKKSIFDPCPVGWRIPPFLNSLSPFLKMESGWSLSSNGMSWAGIGGYFPASGGRDGGSGGFYNVNTHGYYWSGAPADFGGYHLGFDSEKAGLNSSYRSAGFPVRCIKE